MSRWKRWLSGFQILSEYKAAWFSARCDGRSGADYYAGASRHRLCVASGLPGIYGLYATIVPLLAYAVFGPSRILVLGPDSSLAPVILAVVLHLSGGDAIRAGVIASMMAVISG